MTNKQKKCQHDWHNNYDCFEDARILELDTMGIPVRCEKCGILGVEWWVYSSVRDVDGNILD